MRRVKRGEQAARKRFLCQLLHLQRIVRPADRVAEGERIAGRMDLEMRAGHAARPLPHRERQSPDLRAALARPQKGEPAEHPPTGGGQPVMAERPLRLRRTEASRQAGVITHRAAVRELQRPAVQRELRVGPHAERVVKIDLQLLLRRKIVARVVFRAQIPRFQEPADLVRLCAHADVHDQPLAAGIRRGDDPMAPRPVKLRFQPELGPGPAVSPSAPEAAAKEDLPVRLRWFCRRTSGDIVIFLCVLDAAGVKGCLQLPEIGPRVFHRGETQLRGDGSQTCFLLRCGGIFPQKSVKLRFPPHPRLLQRRRVAAGEQQPQKVREIPGQRVHAVRRRVHRAHGEDHTAEAADEAVVNAVDARPAEDGRALRRAEIRQVFLPPLHAQRGEVQAAAQELLKCPIHKNLTNAFAYPIIPMKTVQGSPQQGVCCGDQAFAYLFGTITARKRVGAAVWLRMEWVWPSAQNSASPTCSSRACPSSVTVAAPSRMT